jgi:hypothetical protein
MLNVHLTAKSSNKKTGPIPVSTTSAATCPTACPLKKSGCYADGGPLAIIWRKVTDGAMGTSWREFCDKIAALPLGQLWRHNQAGDLPGDGVKINRPALRALVAANTGRRGFTYTHYRPDGANAEAIREANASGFVVNLSANSLAHADELAKTGAGPVVTLLPENAGPHAVTPEGRKVVTCPATYRESVTCMSCQLCARGSRTVIIGFPAHGASRRKAEAVAVAA